MINGLYQPAILVYFNTEDNFYNKIRELLSITEISNWPQLEKLVFEFMKLHNKFAFRNAIEQNINIRGSKGNRLIDMVSEMIEKTEDVSTVSSPNILLSYVALYEQLKQEIPIVQKIASTLDDIRNKESKS